VSCCCEKHGVQRRSE